MPDRPGIMTSSTASCGRVGLERLPGAEAVGDGLHGIPRLGQLELDEVADVGVVVGHEDTDGAGIGVAGRRRHGTPWIAIGVMPHFRNISPR